MRHIGKRGKEREERRKDGSGRMEKEKGRREGEMARFLTCTSFPIFQPWILSRVA